MPALTLLDYQVFSQLCDQFAAKSGRSQSTSQFTDWVLGYGFTPKKNQPVEFQILCSPQAAQQLRDLVEKIWPDQIFTFQETPIAIKISDSSPDHALQHAIVVQNHPEKNITGSELKEQVRISVGQTVKQAILQENQKLLVPEYLLRFTPYTSPNLIVLRIALRQIHYLHNAGPNRMMAQEQLPVLAKMNEISRWSQLSRTSIYRLLHEDPRSRWLIEVENRGAFQNAQGQHIALSNAYALNPLQLTPGDAADLKAYLEEHRSDWDDMDAALIDLARVNRRAIFTFPYRLPAQDDFPEPASLQQVFASVFGPFKPNAQQLALFDKAHENLIGTGFVTVPWYVFRSLLPEYGASIIVFYLMCLPLLFKNGGVQRDTFWMPGGTDQLAGWTGDKSLAKYFPKDDSKGRGRPATSKGSQDTHWRKNKREQLADFFLRVKTRKDPSGQKYWQIQVHDYPILPADQQQLDQTYHLLATLLKHDALKPLQDLFEEPVFTTPENNRICILDQVYQTSPTSQQKQLLGLLLKELFSDYETPDRPIISNFETPVDRLIAIFEPPVQDFIAKNETPVLTIFSVFETYLKILFMIKDSIKQIESNNLQESPNSSSIDTPTRPETSDLSVDEDWQLEKLFKNIDPHQCQIIQSSPEDLTLFKAWLIFGALNLHVKQPVRLAVSKAQKRSAPPQAAASRLAQQPLSQLKKGLWQLLSKDHGQSMGYRQKGEGLEDIVSDLNQLVLGNTAQEKRLLLKRLIDLLTQ